MVKKILLIVGITGFNYCFGVYKSEDILHAIKYNNISYFEEAVKDKFFNPNQLLSKDVGLTALFYTIICDREKIFNMLLECKNIDINQKTLAEDCFPLIFACAYKKNRDYYVKKLLEQPDININNITDDGISALLYVVCDKKHHNLVPLFLNHPDIDLKMLYHEKTIYEWAKDRAYDKIAEEIALNTKIPNEQETLINN